MHILLFKLLMFYKHRHRGSTHQDNHYNTLDCKMFTYYFKITINKIKNQIKNQIILPLALIFVVFVLKGCTFFFFYVIIIH